MSKNRVWGRQFVATPTVVFGITDFSSFQSGQLVKLPGDKKSSRFVRDSQGNMFIVEPPKTKNARVSLAAFRLACGKDKPKVVRTVKS